jgi:RNA polymerase sigma factor (sigma-70 family)
MAFPETRQTLIERLATTSDEDDWRQFLTDYWGPICRFAAGRASLSAADAEDVASLTFEAVLSNRLLARWMLNQSAKLRTLLCSVVRNILSNRARIQQGRERILRQLADEGLGVEAAEAEKAAEQIDAFYAAWVEDLLDEALQSLLEEFHAAGKGDYFRVLYGRLCEDMSMPEIAKSLKIPLTSVENYFKAARKRLAALLEELVRDHVARYCPDNDREQEWNAEWARLGDYLKLHGGLEVAVRRAAAGRSGRGGRQRKKALISATLTRIRLPAASTSGQ